MRKAGAVHTPLVRAVLAAVMGLIGFQFLLIGTIAATSSVVLGLEGHTEAIILPPIAGFLLYVGIEGMRGLSRYVQGP